MKKQIYFFAITVGVCMISSIAQSESIVIESQINKKLNASDCAFMTLRVQQIAQLVDDTRQVDEILIPIYKLCVGNDKPFATVAQLLERVQIEESAKEIAPYCWVSLGAIAAGIGNLIIDKILT